MSGTVASVAPMPALATGEVHVWRACPRAPGVDLAMLAGLLSPEEAARGAHLRFAADRERYVLGRGLSRILLGAAAGADPRDVRLQTGPYGRPQAPGPVRFSVSHSRDRVLVALTLDHDVGVDVERVRSEIAIRALARQFATPSEQSLVSGLDDDGGFVLWTLKEAWAKSTGLGLRAPLTDVTIARAPAELRPGARFTRRLGRDVSFAVLDGGPGYAAAVALAGGPLTGVVLHPVTELGW
jgi:4'-phosphopantetheinyl transferase